MSLLFDTGTDYMKLGFTVDEELTVPIGDYSVKKTISRDLLGDGYSPMLLGTYTDPNGRKFRMRNIALPATAPAPFSEYVAFMELVWGKLIFTVRRETAATVEEPIAVHVDCFINSHSDVS